MIIQINTDKHITVHEAYHEKLNHMVSSELKRFSTQITRLELFLSDEKGIHKGVDEKKCALEARIAGRKPIAVSDTGNSYDFAVKGALLKMKSLLDGAVGRK